MSTPVSATDITNLALDILNTQTVADVEMPGTDEIAATMNRWYDVVRQLCLEGIPWTFASRRKTLTLSAVDPAFGFDDQYPLPNDFLAPIFIDDDKYPLSYWDYTIEDNNLLIDNSGAASLNIGYIKDEIHVVRYSAAFKIYFATKLAAYTAARLTTMNSAVVKRLLELAQVSKIEAAALNGKARPPRAYKESKMLTGRKLYAG